MADNIFTRLRKRVANFFAPKKVGVADIAASTASTKINVVPQSSADLKNEHEKKIADLKYFMAEFRKVAASGPLPKGTFRLSPGKTAIDGALAADSANWKKFTDGPESEAILLSAAIKRTVEALGDKKFTGFENPLLSKTTQEALINPALQRAVIETLPRESLLYDVVDTMLLALDQEKISALNEKRIPNEENLSTNMDFEGLAVVMSPNIFNQIPTSFELADTTKEALKSILTARNQGQQKTVTIETGELPEFTKSPAPLAPQDLAEAEFPEFTKKKPPLILDDEASLSGESDVDDGVETDSSRENSRPQTPNNFGAGSHIPDSANSSRPGTPHPDAVNSAKPGTSPKPLAGEVRNMAPQQQRGGRGDSSNESQA